MMPLSNAIKNAFSSLFGISSVEETKKPVVRVREVSDLEQLNSRCTTMNPSTGRTTEAKVPAGSFAPSGFYASNIDKEILGECVVCRDEFDQDGEPERLTVVPRAGGGGVCCSCLKIYCSDHGGLDEEGRFWCSDCKFTDGIKKTEGAIINALLGRRDKK